jgi:nucleoside-diphosphate-sugar epimerase
MAAVAVTGADGFLGRHLCRHLESSGWTVVRLARDPQRKGLAGYLPFEFPDRFPASELRHVDSVVHCAYAMGPRVPPGLNAEAVRHLLAVRGPSRFLFVSSMSAHDEAESQYGREKLAIERLLEPFAGGLSLRPGFIIGPGGVFVNLARSVQRTPVIPAFWGGRQPIHTVWVEDLCLAVERALQREWVGVLKVGERQPVPLSRFYGRIAHHLGVTRPALPLPGELTLWILRRAEQLRLPLPMTSENLLGLKHLISYDLDADLQRLDLDPRPMDESLQLLDWRAFPWEDKK